MNERIRKLIRKLDNEIGRYYWTDKEKEKFAELIVQECVTRLEQHHPFTKDPEAYLYAISLIEEHFGVEE
jgi:hypothetical protein